MSDQIPCVLIGPVCKSLVCVSVCVCTYVMSNFQLNQCHSKFTWDISSDGVPPLIIFSCALLDHCKCVCVYVCVFMGGFGGVVGLCECVRVCVCQTFVLILSLFEDVAKGWIADFLFY